MRAGGAYDITARLSGAVVAYIVVAFILLSSSVTLGLVVLVGVPVLVHAARVRDQAAAGAPARAAGGGRQADRARRRHGRRPARAPRNRRRAGVLRPLPPRSQEVRVAGVRVALPQSTLDAAQVFIPGLFVVFVTWLGARFAVEGKIQIGELVAFYGYAAFLVIPLRTAAEAVDKITRSLVGARRMLNVLAVERHVDDPESPAAEPPAGVGSGRPALAARRPAGRARLPRLRRSGRERRDRRPARPFRRRGRRRCSATFGWPTCRVETVRRRIVVSEADPVLFAGTLRHELDPWGHSNGHDDRIWEAIGDRERRGRARPAPRRPRRPGRGARPLVLGRPAPDGSCSRARCSPTPRRSCSSSRRVPSTRTPRRGSPQRLREARYGQDDRDRDDQPARARPRGPGRPVRGRARRRRGDAPRAAALVARVPPRRHARGGRSEQPAADRRG